MGQHSHDSSRRRPLSGAAALVGLAVAGCASTPASSPPGAPAMDADATPVPYPEAERLDVTDVYHGTRVADPYRWLEDPEDPRTRAWITQENQLTERWLARGAQRDAIRRRVAELWTFSRTLPPEETGGYLYFQESDGAKDQPVLYRLPVDGGGEPEVVLDPNTFSADGTLALAEDLVFSRDGARLLYGVSDGGSDWVTWRFLDLKTLKTLPDELPWTKFRAPAWLPDGSGVVYPRYPAPDHPLEDATVDNALYLHRMGTDAKDDPLLFRVEGEPTWFYGVSVTSDHTQLLIDVTRSTEERNLVYTLPVDALDEAPKRLVGQWDYQYNCLAKVGDRYYFWTDADAPRGRIIAVDAQHPEPSAWQEIVPEASGTIEKAAASAGGFAVAYLDDAHSALRFFDLTGAPRGEAALPGLGTVDEIHAELELGDAYFRYSSFSTPQQVFRHRVATGETTPFRPPTVSFDPADFVTEQVFYTSKDGTRVPLYIAHKRGVTPTGDNPTLLYGYGGFNIAITPGFSVSNLVFMELGGVYAVANLRGGGEYGREWHEAGTLTHKQNVFDDFIAAAEHLIAEGWTRPDKLAIHGRSNGGLLVGATLLQRPDLFGAAIPGVGVMDMLRYHRFTIGYAWASDYGTVDDPDQFKALLAYSPVHNTREGARYPATLVTTAERDDRVVPAHSFKFAAALQHAQGGPEPVLIRIETRAGHGAGKPTSMKVEEATDILTFLTEALDFDGGLGHGAP